MKIHTRRGIQNRLLENKAVEISLTNGHCKDADGREKNFLAEENIESKGRENVIGSSEKCHLVHKHKAIHQCLNTKHEFVFIFNQWKITKTFEQIVVSSSLS